ncbi:metal ABC transporter substrate-binding protein [Rhizobiaceae bacterium BDR2-2]|uniref:Metal ABC transporter substrate-binding protein n=1 Tax=Ectorhizobium quercum TaxID=2965071 RepID=A0AAE3SUB3_9HYPH|nr:metal ABC transporter substrate-binding protein [Ectorhizobium quercum]MCX8996892.1 metal ABC transporter substrate-binding protein [Ectorhizobium quercum]
MLIKSALTLLAFAALVAASPAAAKDRPKVVTTFTVIADMARNVAGDLATVESITRPGAEIHDYQPTPRDIMRARDADLVLRNGLNLESWFEKFLVNLGDVPSVTVSEGVVPIAIGGGAYDGKPNPHAWMSPDSALIYVANIEKALASLDPDNAAAYAANAAAYSEKIREALEPARERIAALPPERRWLVTSEGAFSYLARDFGLRELYLWPVNADQQGTPQQVRHVIDTIRAEKIGTVFSESTISPEPAKEIARETGAYYGGVLYVDSLSDPDGPVPTYLDLLGVTAATIAEGLAR